MIEAAFVVAGAIFIHAGWTTPSPAKERDVVVPVAAGAILMVVGLVGSWL